MLLHPLRLGAQEVGLGESSSAPPFKLLRAEEDYTYLRDGSPYERNFFDPIKFITLNNGRSIFLTLGGEIRGRIEVFDNRDWEQGRESFYSQRLAVHGVLHLGSHVRVIGELYHGFLSREEREITQDDKLDLHQGFLDITLPVAPAQHIRLRAGRQEKTYGSARLVGLREGPNIRRTFDAASIAYLAPRFNVEALLASEVVPLFDVFDNRRNEAMLFWGVVSQLRLLPLPGATELYYLGFDVEKARYNDGVAPETRHTFGIRRFGPIGPSFRFNTEVMFQFGDFGSKRITAFSVSTDYHYRLHNTRFRPELGIKLDYISGDRRHGDENLNTFNPLFPNPSYFGLLGQLAPMNFFDVHPSVILELGHRAALMIDWDIFWRASKEDGLHVPPRFLFREGEQAESRYIGHQPGIEFVYVFGRHLVWNTEASYFVSGPFIEETGASENIFHFASTMSFRF
jgi:hypothetical protein